MTQARFWQQDPRNFILIGLPPKDLCESIWQALVRQGKDPEAFLRKNLTVAREWIYEPEPTTRLTNRIKVKSTSEKMDPLQHKKLQD